MLGVDLTLAAYEALLRDALVLRRKVSAQLDELNRRYPSPELRDTIADLRHTDGCASWRSENANEDTR
jgi:hypothetical protein